jgi:hypothetical protein
MGLDDSQPFNYFPHHSAAFTAASTGRKAPFQPQRRGGTDMNNCRFATIDARGCRVMHPLVSIGLQTRVALQHSPGEGSGGSS